MRDATVAYGLGELYSRWNGLAAGDFDGDGRTDIVATSWGRNTPWVATPERPHELHVGNFGGRSLGLIAARADAVTGASMPLESFARLGAAIPVVRERIGTFAEYAATTVDQITALAGQPATRVGATTFDHTIFLNRGDRFVSAQLPALTQVAPAFGVVVADFDGNGTEDLFLAQNFSPTAMDVARFDAGVGAVLLGDGRGGFAALGVRMSGISVHGDMRGAAAADFDGDGRSDLAVAQNGAPTTLWRNVGAVPGIRVRLLGPPGNPLGIGAQVARVRGGVRGPARELHAGAGYWSMNAPTTVLAAQAGDSVWVRWPGGREQTVAVGEGRQVVIRADGGEARTSSRSR